MKRKRYNRYSDAIAKRIIQMQKEGELQKTIMKELDICQVSVREWPKKYKKEVLNKKRTESQPRSYTPYSDDMGSMIVKLKKKGKTDKEISTLLEISKNSIWRWKQKYEEKIKNKPVIEVDKNNTAFVDTQYISSKNGEHEKLEEDLAFYKWWNYGERLGFVERLINELKKDTFECSFQLGSTTDSKEPLSQ